MSASANGKKGINKKGVKPKKKGKTYGASK
jgi:hypothetical protein